MLWLFATAAPRAQETNWVYATQLAARVQSSPPRIELSWLADHLPIAQQFVYRKAPSDAAWGEPVLLPGNATSFTDENVEAGRRYEYQVERHGPQHRAFGYITVGIDAPLVEDRGRVILVVERSIAGPIEPQLNRFEQDLVGDGWSVVKQEVNRADRPVDVRAHIQREYQRDPERTKAVVLIGRVPIVRSGNLNVDAHRARPMPADVFYADINGEWTDVDGDGVFDQSFLPSDTELQIGRIDFAELSGRYAASPYPTEIELLRRYFDKNHAYRHARTRPTPRVLIGDTVGSGGGQASAAAAYRIAATTVGREHVHRAPTTLDTPVEDRWVTQLQRNDYLWAFGSGAGSDLTVSNLGTHGPYGDLWATDFIDLKLKGTFYLFFASWMVDWAQPDNFVRSALTAPEFGLAATWSGRPHVFLHGMGSGDTIGHGVRLSQNNDGRLYQNQVHRHLRGIHVALQGDPTLRLNMITPPTEVTTTVAGPDVHVTWNGSADAVTGYFVYRASSAAGPFVRTTDSLVSDTRFVDRNRAAEAGVYMVRAVTLHSGPSGTYWNASQGATRAFTPGAAPATTTPPAEQTPEFVWVDDALPAGALAVGMREGWNWVASDPTPFSGTLAHRSEVLPGLHHHFFANASVPLVVNAGDTLFAYVYLDPANPPRQVMLTWFAEHWEHRAYWGENLIAEGADNTAGRRPMGPLPPVGRWVRLEVPAKAVDMEGRTATGMGFTLFDGRATWDRAGKVGR